MEYIIKKILPDLEGEIIVQEQTYKVPFVVPGDRVEFKIIKHGKKRKLLPLKIHRNAEKRANFDEPRCKYFSQCGGCKGQHFKYDYQWELKIQDLKNQYYQTFGILPTVINTEEIFYYRNRMDFVVEGSLVGLREPQFYNHIVDIDYCFIQKEEANWILKAFREILSQYPHIGFNRKTKEGFIKYITIRIDKTIFIILTINETMLKNDKEYESYLELINKFIKKIQHLEETLKTKISLKECYVNEFSEVSNVSNGKLLYGESYMQIAFGSLNFFVSPDVFFQPNPNIIYKMMKEGIQVIKNDIDLSHNRYFLVDLYCGVGTLSLFALEELSHDHHIEAVIGLESVQNAIEDAKMNFFHFFKEKKFKIPYEFLVEDLGKSIKLQLKQPTILILDPPRSGIHPEVLKWIVKYHFNIDYILYLSCSPYKQFNDMKTLTKWYKITSLIFADPFPHTPHWESLLILKHLK